VGEAGAGESGVGDAGALMQAVNKTSRTKTDMLVNRRKRWNMLAVKGVMMISAPIIAQANVEKSLIQNGQLML
jgi:hypothetical protein